MVSVCNHCVFMGGRGDLEFLSHIVTATQTDTLWPLHKHTLITLPFSVLMLLAVRAIRCVRLAQLTTMHPLLFTSFQMKFPRSLFCEIIILMRDKSGH